MLASYRKEWLIMLEHPNEYYKEEGLGVSRNPVMDSFDSCRTKYHIRALLDVEGCHSSLHL